MDNTKQELPHSEVARKGGESTLKKHGKDHFKKMAQKSVEAKRKKGLFPFNKKGK